MVSAKLHDALAKYTAGNNMILRPFPNPGAPNSHKRNETTPDGRSFEELTAQQPTNFDPTIQYEDDQLLKLNIVGTISGGAKEDRQILLCKVDEAPRTNLGYSPIPVFGNKKQCIVAIVVDAVCYGDSAMADWHLSRRTAALEHLHKSTATGFGTINPEYCGAWVLEVYDSAANLPGYKRYIGVILREHLEGESIRGLCEREEDDEGVGRLTVRPNPVLRAATDGGVIMVDPSYQVRHEITMQLTHGVVTNEHRGARQTMLDAPDVMVVFRRRGERLETPQAVLLATLHTEVRSTRRGDKPLHPFDRFTHNDFEFLDGWYDVDWCYENRFKLDAWMLRQFGLMDEPKEQRRYLTWEELRDVERDVKGGRNSRLINAFAFIAKGGTRGFPDCSLPAIPSRPPPKASSVITPMFGYFRHQIMAKDLQARHYRRSALWQVLEQVITDVPPELKELGLERRAALARVVATHSLSAAHIDPNHGGLKERVLTRFHEILASRGQSESRKRKRDESDD
ncbi:hypothetical protein COL154_001777 [Colletotrichum chrysophilum]|uniref:uncharacterized protein n=1 Tax=Colletotrichum chrysophilum TaxID=1836956 RepID=UPI002300C84F|nr:uncharacterized protein COL26b_000713 [Colletotrichum chrysophilum]KAJ0345213.1 hypothetical protein KNSL1_008602 [Colletotrichum chrysophilum]KAJ0369971.1 hypothetical protein COL154_001777 [Colletotrichum chrysophilum]KAJ0380873.1 hypothetical protein COL26b_000713 [Colletotrichum chrysophilum]